MKYIILLVFSLLFNGCEIPKDIESINVKDKGITKVCLEGHVYYSFSTYPPGGGYTLKVTDEGKPIKCTNR